MLEGLENALDYLKGDSTKGRSRLVRMDSRPVQDDFKHNQPENNLKEIKTANVYGFVLEITSYYH
jgi:hypothetical protein